jgi:hypothetical protein
MGMGMPMGGMGMGMGGMGMYPGMMGGYGVSPSPLTLLPSAVREGVKSSADLQQMNGYGSG